ncbi:hypothetical protein PFISCL1PPCAC_8912, partial [Pristionchus fissidentatus]
VCLREGPSTCCRPQCGQQCTNSAPSASSSRLIMASSASLGSSPRACSASRRSRISVRCFKLILAAARFSSISFLVLSASASSFSSTDNSRTGSDTFFSSPSSLSSSVFALCFASSRSSSCCLMPERMRPISFILSFRLFMAASRSLICCATPSRRFLSASTLARISALRSSSVFSRSSSATLFLSFSS